MRWLLALSLLAAVWLSSCSSLDVVAGGDVVLRCRFSSSLASRDDSTLFWIVSNVLGTDNAAIDEKRYDPDYELVFEPSQGVYDLHIKRTRYERDNGKFKCTMKEDNTGRELHSQTLDLTVLLTPSQPVIRPKEVISVTEGQMTNITCSSRGGSPSPTLKWMDNEDREVNSTLVLGKNKDEETVAVLGIVPTKEDDKAVFKCSVYNRAMGDKKPMVDQTAIRVNYFPRVQVGPSEVVGVELGSSATLRCSVDARPSITSLEWRHNNVLMSSQSELVLSQVSKEDNGKYECVADNNLGEVGKDALVLDVQYAPQVSLEEMVEVDETEEVSIECRVDANPEVNEILWLKENEPEFRQLGSTLKIRRVKAKQAGKYTCVAKNKLRIWDKSGVERSGRASVVLQVRHQPGKAFVVTESMENKGSMENMDNKVVVVVSGSNAEIRCRADPPGYPLPKFHYWLDTTSDKGLAVASLTLSPVRMSSGGRYWCQPENALGVGEASSFEVEVQQAPKLITQLQPTIIKRAGNSNFQVTCSARGKPKPSIQWLKDEMEIERNAKLFEVVTSEKMRGDSKIFTVQSTLKFKGDERIAGNQLMANDRGRFSCKFDNSVASISTSMHLRIEHAPIVVHRHNKVAADIGSQALITCQMQAYPVPRFDWSLGKSLLQVSNDELMSNTSLINEDVFQSALLLREVSDNDYGDYTCRAVNNMGAKRTIIRLQPKGKPEQPTHLRPLESTSTSITLVFDANFDGGYNDTKFVVQYHRNKDNDVPLYKECSESVCKLTKLQPNSLYVVRVKASNIRGESKYSRKLVVATKIDLDHIPKPDQLVFATSTHRLHLKVNQQQNQLPLVARIEIENDDGTWTHHDDFILDIQDTIMDIHRKKNNSMLSKTIDNELRVRLCVQSNKALCGPYVLAERVEEHVESHSISVIVAVILVVLIVLLLIVLLCLLNKCCCRTTKTTEGNTSNKHGDQSKNNRPSIVHASMPPYGIENKGVDTLKDLNDDLYKNNIYSVQNNSANYEHSKNGNPMSTNPMSTGQMFAGNSNSGTTGGSVNSQDSLWNVTRGVASSNVMSPLDTELELQQHQQQLILAGKSPVVVHELPNYPYPEEYLGHEQSQQLLNSNDPYFQQHQHLLLRHSQLQQQQQFEAEYGQHQYGNAAMLTGYALGDPYVHSGSTMYNPDAQMSPSTSAMPTTTTNDEGDEALNRGRKIIREIIV